MNKLEKKIESKFGRDTGYRVPDGYFDDIYSRISAAKGAFPEAPEEKPLSRWHKIRPYIYLAAMFAGIWCMMKMFTMIQTGQDPAVLDNPPAMLAEVISHPDAQAQLEYADEFSSTISEEASLQEDIRNEYADFNEFEAEFDYEFREEYASINVPDEILDTNTKRL